MNNVEGTQGVPLTVFGGAVPELAPEDLPEGASPFCQDVDFNPGSVFTRAGRQTQHVYFNLNVTGLAQAGVSVPGPNAPYEAVWNNPNYIIFNDPTTPRYAQTTLNQSINVSNIVQYNTVVVNSPATLFQGSFKNPVTAGNYVFISFYINDTAVQAGVEAPWVTQCIDDKGQLCNHVTNHLGQANFFNPTYNLNNGFLCCQTIANGGALTFTVSVENWYTTLPIRPCAYSMVLIEIQDTNNTGGNDPLMSGIGTSDSAVGGVTTTSTAAADCWSQNSILIGTIASDAFTSPATPYLIPGGYIYTNNGFNIVSDIWYTNTGFYKEIAILGRNFMEPFSMNGSNISIAGVPNTLQWSSSNVCITLQMNHPPNISHPGVLPNGVDQLRQNLVVVNTGIAITADIAWPQVTPTQQGMAFYIAKYSPGVSTQLQNYPLGWLGSALLQGGNGGTLFITPCQAGVPLTGQPNGFPSVHVTGWGPGGLGVQTASMVCFTLPTLTNSPAGYQDSFQLGGAYPHQTFTAINGVPQGSTLLLFVNENIAATGNINISAVSDTFGNQWTQIYSYLNVQGAQIFGAPSLIFQQCWMAQNVAGAGPNTLVITTTNSGSSGAPNMICLSIQGALAVSPAVSNSQVLEAINFGLSIPTTQAVLGTQLVISGHQSGTPRTLPSQLVQYTSFVQNTLQSTPFSISFQKPVTAGNTVAVFFFVHDPNGSVEQLKPGALTDNQGTAADVFTTHYSVYTFNDMPFFGAFYKVKGGALTYSATFLTSVPAPISPSHYSAFLVEMTGTDNTLNPFDMFEMNINQTFSGILESVMGTLVVNRSNCILLTCTQMLGNSTQGFTLAYSRGGYYANVPQSMRVLLENTQLASSSTNYFKQSILSATIFTANPRQGGFDGYFNSQEQHWSNYQSAFGVGVYPNPTWHQIEVVVAFRPTQIGFFNTPPALDNPGPLSVLNAYAGNSGGVTNATITWPTIPGPGAGIQAMAICVFLQYPTQTNAPWTYPTYPLGYFDTYFGSQGHSQIGAGVLGIFTAPVGLGLTPTAVIEPPNVACYWLAQTVTFAYTGNFSSFWVNTAGQGATISSPGGNFTLTNPVNASLITAGNMIVVALGVQNIAGTGLVVTSVTDAANDTFSQYSTGTAANGAGGMYMSVWVCLKANGLNKLSDIKITATVGSGSYTFAGVAWEMHAGTSPATAAGTPLDPSAHLSVQLANTPGAPSYNFSLPSVDGPVTLGSALTNPFGIIPLNAASIDSSALQFNISATESTTAPPANFYIYAVQLIVYLTPNPAANFTWVKTYEQSDNEIDTLALDAAGRLWDEDVDLNPGTFTNISTTILPNSYAKSVTFQDIEYIAFSNLLQGTDVPRQWNGSNLDRISMVGPGDKCSASSAGTGSSGSGQVPIQNITQAPPVQIRRIAWGTNQSPQVSTPGNLLVVFGEGRNNPANPTQVDFSSLAPYTPSFGTNTNVVITGVPVPFPKKDSGSLPYNINGTYLVGNVSLQNVGGNENAPTFTLPSPTTTWAYSADYTTQPWPPNNTPTSGWFYQSCIATITMAQPLPNVGPNSSIQISGTMSAYDGTWTVLQAPNSSQMNITEAHVTGNVAIYTFQLVSGSMPQAGQLVTVQNVLNSGAGDPQIFNTTQTISAINDNQFSFGVSNPDTGQNLQSPPGLAYVSGSTFTFDAGQIVNSGNPVNGGFIVQQGLLATGIRKVCYSFLTRSGYITQPSPIATFNITGGSGAITVSNLSPGPSNVVARIVFFTGANSANFFYIPQTQIITVGGVKQTNTATIVPDNATMTAQFNFSDAVLLSATAIDITGNNLFNTIELGSCRGLLTYSSRMFAWGEQLKVTNFRNLSFDGGFTGQVNAGVNASTPLGWNPVGGGGLLLLTSPVFGWSYQIQNTGGVQATWGMITQGAYQDEFGVAIIASATLYSVRITALALTPIASGSLVVDLYSPNAGGSVGTFTLPLSSLTSTMQIYTGTLLTTALRSVPNDLLLRIWAQNIPGTPTSTIQIDRVEPFQTLVPVNSTALKGSYVNNQEAFDLLTGVCGPAQNMQPINGAMELFDLLYALKEKSWFSTFDNGVTEPNKWNWKTVSQKTGTIGINSYDFGEGWALSADREGVHFFEGGEPLKISQEIQPVWDAINWQYGYTIWLRNDPEQKRFTVGIPIATPNQWMPEFPVNANPTSPNVILMCNYRELNSGQQLAQTGPIRSTYMGRLMSPEPARKWSFWNIACPYSDFIDRNNNQWPQFYCTGYNDNKVFALQASMLNDDGAAINSFWVSYGFVKPEMADAKGLGLFRMEFPYLTILATGSGTLNVFVYPESPFNNPPYDLDPLPLPALSQGDLELGVNIKGNRFFIRVGTNAVGSAFRLSKLVVPLIPDSWSPVRGWNAITA